MACHRGVKISSHCKRVIGIYKSDSPVCRVSLTTTWSVGFPKLRAISWEGDSKLSNMTANSNPQARSF